MDKKRIENILYTTGKAYMVINDHYSFAIVFENTVSKLLNGTYIAMKSVLQEYFLSIGMKSLVLNSLNDLKYDDKLNSNIEKNISAVKKLDGLNEQQLYIIAKLKADLNSLNNGTGAVVSQDVDVSTVDINTFVESFNYILEAKDISSILLFILNNGLLQLYNYYISEDKEPLFIFKDIYDEINSTKEQEEVGNDSEKSAFIALANSVDDKSFKENCLFLSKEEIEFHIDDNSTDDVLNKFKLSDIDLTLNKKQYEKVEDVLSAILNDDDFISSLSEDEVSEIKKLFCEVIRNIISKLKTKLGIPEMIAGNDYNAMQILNIVLNKTIGRTYMEMIELTFKADNIDTFKENSIYDETLYDGLYDDFADIFNNDIAPSSDTGYKLTDDRKLFWESALKLYETIFNEDKDSIIVDKVLDGFALFGKVAFNCTDYMMSLKMLFTMLNNVTEDRIYLLTYLITIHTTDSLYKKISKFL